MCQLANSEQWSKSEREEMFDFNWITIFICAPDWHTWRVGIPVQNANFFNFLMWLNRHCESAVQGSLPFQVDLKGVAYLFVMHSGYSTISIVWQLTTISLAIITGTNARKRCKFNLILMATTRAEIKREKKLLNRVACKKAVAKYIVRATHFTAFPSHSILSSLLDAASGITQLPIFICYRHVSTLVTSRQMRFAATKTTTATSMTTNKMRISFGSHVP